MSVGMSMVTINWNRFGFRYMELSMVTADVFCDWELHEPTITQQLSPTIILNALRSFKDVHDFHGQILALKMVQLLPSSAWQERKRTVMA